MTPEKPTAEKPPEEPAASTTVTDTSSLLSIARPLGWKDTFMRAAKTAVATLITGFPLNQLASFDLSAVKVVAFAAASAGGSIIINRVLAWTQSS